MSDAADAFDRSITDAEELLARFDQENSSPSGKNSEALKRAGLVMALAIPVLKKPLDDADTAAFWTLVERAAATKSRTVAEVRSAVALTEDQHIRLAAALANATGKQVELKVIVDPTVLGGLVAQVGDTVIDGSVRSRLDQIKSLL